MKKQNKTLMIQWSILQSFVTIEQKLKRIPEEEHENSAGHHQ